MNFTRALLTLAVALLLAAPSFSQGPATGYPPFGSFHDGGFDAVNRQNLNVNFSVPIVSIPGRGTGFNFSIVYDSAVWERSDSLWLPVVDRDGNPFWGWKKDTPVGSTRAVHTTRYCGGGAKSEQEATTRHVGFRYTDPSGTKHSFPLDFHDEALGCGFNTEPTIADAEDESGYKMDATDPYNPRVYDKSGLDITDSGIIAKDANGNFISKIIVSSTETKWTDTLGRFVLRMVKRIANCSHGGASYTECWDYIYRSSDGVEQTATLYVKSFTVTTAFGCGGDYNQPSKLLPEKLVLPNGRFYTFEYETNPDSSITARLKKITLPTGGSYEYAYSGTNGGINCTNGTIHTLDRIITGPSSSTWKSRRAQVGPDWDTTVTDPANNDSVFKFSTGGALLSSKFYAGLAGAGGTLLRTINTTWAANGTPASSTVILEDGTTQSKTETVFDNNGNPTEMKEYAFGSGLAGPLIRRTTFAWRHSDTSVVGYQNYLNANLLNRLTEQLVYEGQSTLKAGLKYSYDGSALAQTSGVPQHDYSSHSFSNTVRGNLTQVQRWSGTTYSTLGTNTYNDLGNLLTTAGAVGAATEFFYGDNYSAGETPGAQAYPSEIKRTLSSVDYKTRFQYFYPTGAVAAACAANHTQTNCVDNLSAPQADYAKLTYDSFGRPTVTNLGHGGQATSTYNDTASPPTVVTSNKINPTDQLVTETEFDSLARPVKQKTKDASGNVKSIVDIQYDTLGRAYRQSHPYTGASPYWTETVFDAMGRATETRLLNSSFAVIPGNTTTYSYSLNTVTVTDPAGQQRKTESDSLGRIVKVYEPDVTAQNALTQVTTYTYNVRDQLTGVQQGVQTRTYVYDAMGRLTSQTTPEAGQWSFQYDAADRLTQRTDARGVVTTYSYDDLHRITSVTYNVGSTGVTPTDSTTFEYGTNTAQNNLGRVAKVTKGSGASEISDAYTYDVMGRGTQVTKKILGTTYPLLYEYDLAGDVTKITYPSGREVVQAFDSVGRFSGMSTTNSIGTGNYAYNAAGQVTGFSYSNGVTAAFGYSADRLQLNSIAHVRNATNVLALNYYYTTDPANCPNAAGGNNGLIRCIKDNSDPTQTPGAGGRSLSYSYDALGRLGTTASSGSTQFPQWGLSWSYDRYGNRTAQTATAGSPPANSLSFATTSGAGAYTNRPDEYSHDANGNMTHDGTNMLVYDAADRMLSAAGVEFKYDPSGLRVKKCVPNCTTHQHHGVPLFRDAADR